MKIFRKRRGSTTSEDVINKLNDVAQIVHDYFPPTYDEVIRLFIEFAGSKYNFKLDEDYTEKDIDNALSWYDDWELED